MRKIYLICGVPGAGKSWVCKRASSRYDYIPHDDYIKDEENYLDMLTSERDRPVITECPFGERALREKIEFAGGKVVPVFVVESADTVRDRYFKRRGTLPAKNVLTRAATIKERAKEWEAFSGTSEQVLEFLKSHA